MTSPSADGDFSSCEARTVAFLETNIGGQSTFVYESLTSSLPNAGDGCVDEAMKKPPIGMVRMCIKSANGFSTYHVDMPVHNVLRYTNSTKMDDAVGLMTLAASAGALNVVVTHNTYWGAQTTNVSPLAGQTPFHGIPVIDASKLLLPIIDESFLAKFQANGSSIVDEKSERKAKIKGVDMGFKVYINTLNEDGSEKEAGGEDCMVVSKVLADISLNPRCIQPTSQKANPFAICQAHDFRLAPHGCVPMDKAHVLCLYCSKDGGNVVDKVIMNLNFNASPEVGFGAGGGGVGAMAGKKHTWQYAIPSAIDEDSGDEDIVGEKNTNTNADTNKDTNKDRKKLKKAGLEVSSSKAVNDDDDGGMEDKEENGSEGSNELACSQVLEEEDD
jgi:hypothetical protein